VRSSSSQLTASFPWICSIAVHGGLAAAVWLMPVETSRPAARPPIEILEQQLPAAETPPAPEPDPPTPAASPRLAMTTTPIATRRKPLPQPSNPEPPSDRTEPATPEMGPQTFGIQLSGGVQAAPGQGVQVPVGDSLAVSPKITRRSDKKVAAKPGFKTDYAPGEEAPTAVLTTKPKMLQKITPEYPESIKDLGIEGRVILEVTVDATGKVIEVKVLRGLHPVLDQTAVAAARKLVFSPATVNGRAVKTKIPVPFAFILD
jgi:TonB family protein